MTARMTQLRWPIIAALLAALVVLAGCADPFADSKDDAVQIVTEEETKRTIDEYAREIAEVAGAELTRYETNSAPCTGQFGESAKDIYTTQGGGQVFVPQERHAAIIGELRRLWLARGYEEEPDRRKQPNPDDKVAVHTTDGFRLRVTNTEPPTALSLLIGGPCRRSPTPLW